MIEDSKHNKSMKIAKSLLLKNICKTSIKRHPHNMLAQWSATLGQAESFQKFALTTHDALLSVMGLLFVM